jgi:hypothetical protein
MSSIFELWSSWTRATGRKEYVRLWSFIARLQIYSLIIPRDQCFRKYRKEQRKSSEKIAVMIRRDVDEVELEVLRLLETLLRYWLN